MIKVGHDSVYSASKMCSPQRKTIQDNPIAVDKLRARLLFFSKESPNLSFHERSSLLEVRKLVFRGGANGMNNYELFSLPLRVCVDF